MTSDSLVEHEQNSSFPSSKERSPALGHLVGVHRALLFRLRESVSTILPFNHRATLPHMPPLFLLLVLLLILASFPDPVTSDAFPPAPSGSLSRSVPATFRTSDSRRSAPLRDALFKKSPSHSLSSTRSHSYPSSSSASSHNSERVGSLSRVNDILAREDRQLFVSKVYLILFAQLLTTGGFIALAQRNMAAISSLLMSESGPLLHGLSTFVTIASFYALLLSPDLRRGKWKYPLLGLFTVGESSLVALLTLFFPRRVVAQAAGVTAFAAGSISLYTAKNKNPRYDLTRYGTFLYSLGTCFLILSLMHLLGLTVSWMPRIPWNEKLMCSLGAGLFSAYLSVHTKMVVGGGSAMFHEKDYIFAALQLYSDIINLFVYLLRIMSASQSGKKSR